MNIWVKCLFIVLGAWTAVACALGLATISNPRLRHRVFHAPYAWSIRFGLFLSPYAAAFGFESLPRETEHAFLLLIQWSMILAVFSACSSADEKRELIATGIRPRQRYEYLKSLMVYQRQAEYQAIVDKAHAHWPKDAPPDAPWSRFMTQEDWHDILTANRLDYLLRDDPLEGIQPRP